MRRSSRACPTPERSPTSADAMGLSVVLPAYNEAANVSGGVLAQVVAFLRASGSPFEVIVVDDGSVDETAELAQAVSDAEPSVRVVRTHHGGKAHALVTGLDAARGRVVLFSDI